MSIDLEYLAARLGYGTLNADDMRATVDALMNEGFYDESCLEALDSRPAIYAEVRPAFVAALKHYGVNLPNREEAAWLLAEHHLRSIADDSVDAYDGLQALFNELWSTLDFRSSRIEGLLTLFWDAHCAVESIQDATLCELSPARTLDQTLTELRPKIKAEAVRYLSRAA